jgi:hemoglobin-like flavoprotein
LEKESSGSISFIVLSSHNFQQRFLEDHISKNFTTMVKEVNADSLKIVLDSWGVLKKQDDFEKVAGTKVMKFLFEKCPKAKPMFGYDIEAEVVDPAFLKDKKFVAHSIQLIGMFDTALSLLGPGGTLLDEKIKELGEKHINYGVRAEMFPIMGKALFHTLAEELGDDFTDAVHDAWKVVFAAISQSLMKTVLAGTKDKQYFRNCQGLV